MIQYGQCRGHGIGSRSRFDCSRSHVRVRAERKEDPNSEDNVTFNPVELGRKSRQAFDEVWNQMARISSPKTSFTVDELYAEDMSLGTFETPQAPFTNVLVVGGTGRVGRVLVRKLLLRGYSVKVFVRNSEGDAQDVLPASVELFEGDVGNLADCQRAVEGVDKIVYCASSTIAITANINRVDEAGVGNVARAFLDAKHRSAQRAGSSSPALKTIIADFSNEEVQEEWDILQIGPLEEEKSDTYRGQDFASALISEDLRRLSFSGSVYSRNGIAEFGGPVLGLPSTEGIIVHALTDGKPYTCILVDNEGHSYSSRFNTRLGYNNIRLPINSFRAMDPSFPPMTPSAIEVLKFRYDKSQLPSDVRNVSIEEERRVRNTFLFEVSYIKALPVNDEPALVLLSCAGSKAAAAAAASAAAAPDDALALTDADARKLAAKRRGEQVLRNSGVGYTIVRPGPMYEEPGGYRAMLFDQGNRIREGIGYADVADVCLRALHSIDAVNKTFEVCYEYTPEEGLQMYELVAHVPDRGNNYLEPALSVLERNT